MPTDSGYSMVRLRKSLGLAQAEMARRMGLSLRPYQEIEAHKRKVRRRHIRLAESVALDVAIERKDPELAPPRVRNKAVELARAILARNFREKALELADIILDRDQQ